MSELYIKQELFKTLPQLDAILLDVDGVILDVSQSYRVCVMETAQWYAREILQLEDNAPLMSGEDIEGFKMAGGFNSDWDLTNAAVMFIIAKKVQAKATNMQAVVEHEPSWEYFTSEIKRRGGGYPVAEMIVLEMLTAGQRRDFAHAFKSRLVTQVFQEMYGGDDACKDLYGFDPQYIRGEGLYKNEKVLLDVELLKSLS